MLYIKQGWPDFFMRRKNKDPKRLEGKNLDQNGFAAKMFTETSFIQLA